MAPAPPLRLLLAALATCAPVLARDVALAMKARSLSCPLRSAYACEMVFWGEGGGMGVRQQWRCVENSGVQPGYAAANAARLLPSHSPRLQRQQAQRCTHLDVGPQYAALFGGGLGAVGGVPKVLDAVFGAARQAARHLGPVAAHQRVAQRERELLLSGPVAPADWGGGIRCRQG